MNEAIEETTSEEVDSPVNENQSYSDDQDDNAPDTENAEESESDGQQEAEYVELEGADGKTYQVPSALKDQFLMRQDYTRKTMEVAEKAKDADFRAQMAQQTIEREQFIQRNVEDVTTFNMLQQQYKTIANMDLMALSQEDPIQAQQLLIQKQNLERAMQTVDGRIQQKEAQLRAHREQETASMRERGLTILKREIPDWNAEKANQIREYAVSKGANHARIDSIIDPLEVMVLHKAMLYDKLMDSQATKVSPNQKAKPVTKLGQKATSSRDPEKMSMDEWVKWRDSELRKRKG